MNAQPQPLREWFYDRDGVAEGPFDLATLRSMIGTRLSPQTMVWKDGQPEWLPASQLEEFRIPGTPIVVPPAIRVPPPPPPARAPVLARPVPVATPSGAVQLMQPVATGQLVLLSILTFGIYGLVKFYQAGLSLSALTGRPSRFASLFWWYVGLSIGASVLSVAGVGILLMIAALVVGGVLLSDTIDLRDEVLRQHGASPDAMVAKTSHVALWVTGAVLTFGFIGVFVLLYQGVKFFEEYAATLQAARRNAR